MKKIILLTVLFLPGSMFANGDNSRSTWFSHLWQKTGVVRGNVMKKAYTLLNDTSEKALDLWDTGCYTYNDYIGGAVELTPVDSLSPEEYLKRVDIEAHERLEQAIHDLHASSSSVLGSFISKTREVATLQWWKEAVGTRTMVLGASLGTIVAVYATYKKFFEDKREPYLKSGSVKDAMRKKLGVLAVASA